MDGQHIRLQVDRLTLPFKLAILRRWCESAEFQNAPLLHQEDLGLLPSLDSLRELLSWRVRNYGVPFSNQVANIAAILVDSVATGELASIDIQQALIGEFQPLTDRLQPEEILNFRAALNFQVVRAVYKLASVSTPSAIASISRLISLLRSLPGMNIETWLLFAVDGDKISRTCADGAYLTSSTRSKLLYILNAGRWAKSRNQSLSDLLSDAQKPSVVLSHCWQPPRTGTSTGRNPCANGARAFLTGPLSYAILACIVLVVTLVALYETSKGSGPLFETKLKENWFWLLVLAACFVSRSLPDALIVLLARKYSYTHPHSVDLSIAIDQLSRVALCIPIQLVAKNQVDSFIRHLASLLTAMASTPVRIVLLLDLPDASSPDIDPVEQALLSHLRHCLESSGLVSARDSAGRPALVVLYRERTFSVRQNVWMGWERKRGKLERFNALIARGDKGGFQDFLDSTNALDKLNGVDYAVVLDEDSWISSHSVTELLAAALHPANKPEICETNRLLKRGHVFFAPQYVNSFDAAVRFPMVEYFAGQSSRRSGNPVQKPDVWYLASGLAVNGGKGLYDIRAADTLLADKFPEDRILSHDILEGIVASAVHCPSAQVFDNFPSTYAQYALRAHRWIRGDFQNMLYYATWGGGRGNLAVREVPGALLLIYRALIRFQPVFILMLFFPWSGAETPSTDVSLIAASVSIAVAAVFATALDICAKLRVLDIVGSCLAIASRLPSMTFSAILTLALVPYNCILVIHAFALVVWRWRSGRALLQWQSSASILNRRATRGFPVVCAIAATALVVLLTTLNMHFAGSISRLTIVMATVWVAAPWLWISLPLISKSKT